MRTLGVKVLSTVGLAVCATTFHSGSAAAYPIDCAILLCMAGGFPASAECTAAKAEVIRRITPIPVEPPLQIWRCPMKMDLSVAAAIGLPLGQASASGYTKEVLEIQSGIELYDITYRISHSHGDETIRENTKKGVYGIDTFNWVGASYRTGPEWLAGAVGGYRQDIYRYYGRDDQYRKKVGEVNASRTSFRAIVMRFRDHAGNYQTQTIRY